MSRSITENIAGYQVDTMNVESCVADIGNHVENHQQTNTCRWLACMNPHSFTESKRDYEFSSALHDADWLIPDGSGIVLASKVLGGRIKSRVTGSDVFEGVSEAMNRSGSGRVFFLGSTAETLQVIEKRMRVDYPNLAAVGTYSPPFKTEFTSCDLHDMISAINAYSPDVLWVGMTAPKQEKWLHQNKDNLNIKFAGAIGAVFDFYAGNVKRSNPAFQKLHLEWLPRLVQQPKRLWKRMLISAPIFMWSIFKQRFRGADDKDN